MSRYALGSRSSHKADKLSLRARCFVVITSGCEWKKVIALLYNRFPQGHILLR